MVKCTTKLYYQISLVRLQVFYNNGPDKITMPKVSNRIYRQLPFIEKTLTFRYELSRSVKVSENFF